VYVPAGRRIRALKRSGFGQTFDLSNAFTDCTDPANYGAAACVNAPGLPSLPVGVYGGGNTSLMSLPASLATDVSNAAAAITGGGSSSASLSTALPWILGGVILFMVAGAYSGKK
jgi:hypothetical protein